MSLINVTLSPLDCMSVGFFLANVLRNSSQLYTICLNRCSIDDHSIALMMGELSKHAEACPAGALHGVKKLIITGNKIGDNGIAHIATALQTNTTMRALDMSNCSISDKGSESLARALAVNRSLQDLVFRNNKIGDNGIAHIATALQTNTTMTELIISKCIISDKGAESLARALAVNRSLQDLNIGGNEIGDNGIAHIATALQTNTTLRRLAFDEEGTTVTTDEGALSLAAALTANSSMKHLELYWSSTHPDSTLKKIGEYLRTSMLNRLDLVMNMQRSGGAPVTEERAMVQEWLQCVEVGGKELIQSLEDSHHYRNLRGLRILLDHQTRAYMETWEKMKKSIRALRATVKAVNTERKQKGLPYVDIWLLDNKQACSSNDHLPSSLV